MTDLFFSTPFFGLAISILCWCFAGWLQKKTGLLVCNPVLVTSLLVIGVMLVFHIPLEHYNAGGSIIKLMLGPATAVLALNIYQTFYGRSGPQWKGYGQAQAVLFCILVVVIGLIQLKATRSKEVQQ